MEDVFVAKFEGGLADQHKLPAYEATQSLYGITRSLILITNYLDEGRVRHKNFSSSNFQLNIVAQRSGSFETVFELISDPATMAIVAAVGINISSNFIYDFIKSIMKRSIGDSAEEDIENLEASGHLNSGDLGALVEAIEPSMREAHKSIGAGASQIVIIKGDNNVVNFDSASKEYVNSSIEDDRIRAKLFSIGSFNLNSGYGRAFDIDEQRTVPFQIEAGVDRDTIQSIVTSISSYAFRRLGDDIRSAIALKYRAILAPDGRVKRIRVMAARKDLREL